MRAGLFILPRAEEDMQSLSPSDFRRVVKTMEFLRDFPLAAQTAGLPDAPDLRRAVAGQYLIYYRYDPWGDVVLVYTVRHGRRKSPEAVEDISP